MRLPVPFPLLVAFGDADADVPPQLVRDYATAARASTVRRGRLVDWVWWVEFVKRKLTLEKMSVRCWMFDDACFVLRIF